MKQNAPTRSNDNNNNNNNNNNVRRTASYHIISYHNLFSTLKYSTLPDFYGICAPADPA